MTTADDRAAAREWVAEHTPLTLDDLLAAVTRIYGDGALIGAATASEATDIVAAALTDLLPDATQSPVDWAAFWNAWTPGDSAAASLLNNGALADLLDNANLTIRGIADTTLDRIGNALADGAASGESVDAIAQTLADILGDPTRAYRIADTELARAVSAASVQTYAANGVDLYDWIVSPGACPLCLDGAADGPYPVDSPDLMVPAHPTCRCAVSPVIALSDAGAAAGAGE